MKADGDGAGGSGGALGRESEERRESEEEESSHQFKLSTSHASSDVTIGATGGYVAHGG
jgi:hypothetical protein